MYTITQQLPRKPNFQKGAYPISPAQWQQDKWSPSLSGTLAPNLRCEHTRKLLAFSDPLSSGYSTWLP